MKEPTTGSVQRVIIVVMLIMTNMIPPEILKLAIEGGWKPNGVDFSVKGNLEWWLKAFDLKENWQKVALDPTFWMALGKAKGWPEKNTNFKLQPKWLVKAYEVVGLILTGQPTEAYWNDIINSK